MTAHRRIADFERWGDRLLLTCPYVVDVDQAPPGIRSRNTIPLTRLFAMDPDAADGLGAVTDRAQRRRWALRPGGILLLPPERAYAFDFAPGMRMAACHFRLESAPGCDVFAHGHPRWRDDRPDLAAELGRAARAGGGFAAAVAFRGLLLQAAALFIAGAPPAPGRYAATLARIEERCRADLPVTALAAELGVGREHFARGFRRALGVSPREHLHRRLTQRACLLLLAGRKVKEAAAELGFSSEFVFSRFFRRRTGQPPSAYRERRA